MSQENQLGLLSTPEILDLETPPQQNAAEPETEEKEEKEEQETSADEQPKEGEEYRPHVSKAQKRINELTWQRRTAEREAAKLQRELEERNAEIQRLKTQQSTQKSVKPKSIDFEDQDEYIDALVDWKMAQGKEQIQTSSNGSATKEPQIPVEVAAQIQNFEKAGRSKYADFDSVALNREVINLYSPAMEEEILTSDFGADIAYYFGTHADEADRISRLSPNKAAREIVKLESKFKKSTTNAPPPINPISPGTTITHFDLSKAKTQKEYEEMRKKGVGG